MMSIISGNEFIDESNNNIKTAISILNLDGSKVTKERVLTLPKINKNLVTCEYAVRGSIAIRAEEIRKDLENGVKLEGINEVINCNIGNPQQLRQKSITFVRQTASLIEYSELLEQVESAHKSTKKNGDEGHAEELVLKKMFPKDVAERARVLIKSMNGSVGAYTHSQGIPHVRKSVSRFIEQRDGHKSDPDSIFLTAGASPGVQLILQSIIQNDNVGIMIPIPQYPLYTATIALNNGKAVPYYLDESKEWGLSVFQLKESIEKSKKAGVDVRAICIINPGNPTGGCLTRSNIEDILRFAYENNLVVLADEVYQVNVYKSESHPFISFKKVLSEIENENVRNNVELISFHSISKGVLGECGRRGGYFECKNISQEAMDIFYKIASISLCPPAHGQLMVELMVNPPKNNDPSYALYKKETDTIYESLRQRSQMLADVFNSLEGVTCNNAQGAMYLFPRIEFSNKFLNYAKELNQPADFLYCMELLNSTGVCVVPGSGFGQEPGTYHFRSTFLPPLDQMEQFLSSITSFHKKFMNTYRD